MHTAHAIMMTMQEDLAVVRRVTLMLIAVMILVMEVVVVLIKSMPPVIRVVAVVLQALVRAI